MPVMGNAIRTGAKRPLKRDVRISEVRNSGVPLYIYTTAENNPVLGERLELKRF